MGVLRYTDLDLRELLPKVISIKWPGEDMILLTPCRAEAMVEAPSDRLRPPSALPWTDGTQDGVVAATRSRLIYQDRSTVAVLLRTARVVLAGSAVATLFLGGGLRGFLFVGLASLIAWALVKVIEPVTVGRAWLTFDQIHAIDRFGQVIEGRLRDGGGCRLCVPDPSDFRLIVSIVESGGLGHAA